jgi:ribosomal protein L21E
MADNQEIKTGDTVTVIISVWREDEQPTISNFYTGKITEIIERSKNAFYVKVKGLDRLIPIDRVSAA